jgi:ribose transport system substrate-binding protein
MLTVKFRRSSAALLCASIFVGLIGAGCGPDQSQSSGAGPSATNGTPTTPATTPDANNPTTPAATTNASAVTLPTFKPGPDGKYKVAFVTNNASDYWVLAHNGVNAAAKELPDLNVNFIMPADGTAATQKDQVNGQIANGVQAIAISPVDPKNETDWLNDISAKAIVITQDSDAADSKRIMYIGTDNHAAGMMAGDLLKKALPNGGKIMLFVGDRSAQNAHDREQGIRDSLNGSNITIVDVRTDGSDRARAKSNAADALVSTPDLAAEVGLWSYNGPSIVSAVEDAGKVGKVKIVCFDEEDGTIAGIKSGAVFATVVQHPYQFGYDGLKILEKLLKGDKSVIPANGLDNVAPRAIDSTNLAKFEEQLAKEKKGS